MKESFYFDAEDRRLFGTYHAPAYREDRRCGVVLCYPLGQEYIRSYRLYHQLAVRLAASGYHVFRFDYFGTGDSAGEDGEGTPALWVRDILCAIEELRDSGDVEKISLIGLRLGAALAALAAEENAQVHSLVLWEPVVDGTAYLQELQTMHRNWLDRQLYRPARKVLAGNNGEILGFPFPPLLRDHIGRIRLANRHRPPAPHCLILSNTNHPAYRHLSRRFQEMGAASENRLIPEPQVWYKDERLDHYLVPNQSLEAIITWHNGLYR